MEEIIRSIINSGSGEVGVFVLGLIIRRLEKKADGKKWKARLQLTLSQDRQRIAEEKGIKID